MDKKYQIFVSSTFEDLKEERDQAIKAVLEMGHIPVGMEMFSAADEEQWQLIARQIEATDYYVVIAAHRYGSETENKISYTEKEYDYAKEMGIPILGFVIDDKASWPSNRIDKSDIKKKKLDKFKTKIKSKMVHFWNGKEDLHGKISISLMKAMNTNPRIGWTRTNIAIGANITKELSRLSAENSQLREQNQLLLKKQNKVVDEVRNVVHILHNNSRKFGIRKVSTWKNAKKYQRTLLEIFLIIAPYLINENSSQGISHKLASEIIKSNEYYSDWPIGSNRMLEFIADYVALNLIEPSKKKHPVNDKNPYWTLSRLGSQLLKSSRRIRLEEGIDTSNEEVNEIE
jgi:hypothetical protein